LDWTNERYVRVYVRDTADLLAVGWEGRAALWEMCRKSDRAGVIDGDMETLPDLLRLPAEVVEAGLGRLIHRKVVLVGEIEGAPCYLIKNFIPAQEAKQSDAQRQRESRAKRRDLARGVTKCDQPSEQSGTKRDEKSHAVTACHTESQPVTPSLAVPSLADPDMSTSGKSQPSDARRVFDFWVEDTGHKRAKFVSKRRTRIEARLREKYTVKELCQAIRNRRNDSHLMGQNDRGTVYDGISTLLRDGEQVERLRDLTKPGKPRGGNGARRLRGGSEAVREQEQCEADAFQGVSDREWMRDD
jgi:hypothetical protein